jgi:hypothetical protein
MTEVFVNYSRTDRRVALPIVVAIGQAGLQVRRPAMSYDGDPVAEQIKRELGEAQCLVVLWSEAAAQSLWVQQEVHCAIRAWSSDRLVLATLDDTPLPVGLRDLSPISIRDATDSGTQQLIERARTIVEKSKSEEFRKRALAKPAPPAPVRAPLPRFKSIALVAGTTVLIGALVSLLSLLSLWVGLWGVPPSHVQGPLIGRPPPVVLLPPRPEPPVQSQPPVLLPPVQSTPWFYREPPVLAAHLPFVLILIVLGAAIGAAALWAATKVRWRWHSKRALSSMLSPPQILAKSNGAAQVFVSYSHQDVRTVDQLVQQIEQLGYAVWIDRQSTGHQRYATAIVGAIRMSRLVALMCSQDAFRSDHVIREVYLAGDFKKPFIVFNLDCAGLPDEILYFVSGFPRVSVATIDPQQLRSQIAQLMAT